MSAYVSSPESFGLLAAYAILNKCGVSDWCFSRKSHDIDDVQRIAKGLARENIRSVAHLYPNDADGSRPGPCLLDAEIEEAAAIYAAHFLTNTHLVRKVTPIQIIKVAQCVNYQSCETEDWKDTKAYCQLDWITSEALRHLPGYEDADWGYEQPIPEIDALYERSGA